MISPLGRIKDCGKPHYQDQMADLIRAVKPKVVVETGLCEGLGAEYILSALDSNNEGHLWSIDPLDPKHEANGVIVSPSFMEQNPITHPRFTWIRQFSDKALEPLFRAIGPFDLFIHDSDHSYKVQTFEYESAWRFVRSGGIIASDDTTWGNHGAWSQFLARHGIHHATKLGNAQYFKKP